MKRLSFIVFLALVAACNQPADHGADKTDTTAVVAAPDSMAMVTPPPVTSDHYFAILPCADCAGVETDITLKSDGSYAIHLLYNGRKAKGPGSNEFSENGRWMLHGTDTVHLMDRKDAPSMFIRTDSSLVQLDMQGKRITGKLADKYILKKK